MVFATDDQLTNEPTEASRASARLDAALASVSPSMLAYTLHEFSGALRINAKEALDRGVKQLISGLPDVEVAKALRFSGWWYGLGPYREDFAAKLATIKVEGALAEHLRPILENLKLLPGMTSSAQ